MAVFAVTYTYTGDVEARQAHRPAHREFLGRLAERGINRCSGPVGSGDNAGALLLIEADSEQQALDHLAGDPFRVNGVVADVSAREWAPVLGDLAARLGA